MDEITQGANVSSGNEDGGTRVLKGQVGGKQISNDASVGREVGEVRES